MKKIIITLIGLFGFAGVAFGLPYFSTHQTMLPFVSSSFDLGTTTQTWRNLFVDQICLGGVCNTSWPAGGGATGAISTTTPLVNTQVVFSTGVASIGNDSAFTWNSTADRLTFTYASTTGWTSGYASSTSGLFGNLSIGSLTGLLKGTSGVVSVATAGTDYQAPISLTTTGTSGAATFIANVLNIPQYTDTNTTYTPSYPITLTGTTFGIAFGTTTNNLWSGLQTFTNSTTTLASFSYASSTKWSGGGLQECNATTGKLNWDSATMQFICDTDQTGEVGGGITSLGPVGQGQTGTTQYFATSTTGTNFTITSTGDTHTFNLPTASASNRGLLSTTDWSTFNGKAETSSAMTGTFDGVDFGNGTLAQNALWVGGAAAIPSELTIGTGGFVLGVSGGAPAWIATTSIPLGGDVTGTLSATVVGDDSHAHTSTTLSGIDISADTNLTAGDGLTLTDDDIDFDGGASPGGSLGGTWASPTIDDLFILNTGDVGTGSYTFPYASTTAISTSYASSTGYFGANLTTCDATTGKITWTNGVFGCGTDFNTGSGGSAYEIATTSSIGVSQLAYFTKTGGLTTIGGVATSTLSATSPLTGSFTQVGTGGALGIQVANTSQGGYLSSTDWNTFNGKESVLSFTWPLIRSTNTITFGGLSTSSTPTVGHLPYFSGVNTFSSVATTSATCSGGISCSTFNVLGSSPITLSSFTYPFPSAATSTLLNFSGGLTLSGGTADFSAATVKTHVYQTFAYSTSTAWTATTTIALGVAFNAEQWSAVKCYTDTGTVNVSVHDGTNRMNLLNASTTIGTFTFTTNNTFTASEKRYIDIGTPASSPTKVSCTTDVIVNN